MKIKIFSILLTSLLISACSGESETDLISEAQYCLDDARSGASALPCLKYIDGIYSQRAQVVRCSIHLFATDVTTLKNLMSVYTSIEDGNGAAGVLSALNMRVTNEKAKEIHSYCLASGSVGMQFISSLAKTATVIANATPMVSGQQDPEQIRQTIETILDDIALDPSAHQETIAVIGGTIQGMYHDSCTNPDSNNVGICSSIQTATESIDISTSSPEEIGTLLLEYWKTLGN